MDLGEHLAGLREAMAAFGTRAQAAGLDAPVPTTPDWDVRRLVAHQGLVHRWATATLLGERIDEDAVEHEGLSADEPVGWLREGAARLVAVLE
ncbi:MAG: maleylpyruvate isomerase N-terminal domain-containing protein, partial [Nocardioides sp.]